MGAGPGAAHAVPRQPVVDDAQNPIDAVACEPLRASFVLPITDDGVPDQGAVSVDHRLSVEVLHEEGAERVAGRRDEQAVGTGPFPAQLPGCLVGQVAKLLRDLANSLRHFRAHPNASAPGSQQDGRHRAARNVRQTGDIDQPNGFWWLNGHEECPKCLVLRDPTWDKLIV